VSLGEVRLGDRVDVFELLVEAIVEPEGYFPAPFQAVLINKGSPLTLTFPRCCSLDADLPGDMEEAEEGGRSRTFRELGISRVPLVILLHGGILTGL